MFTGVYGSWLQLLVNIHGKCGGGFLTTISLWFSFHIFLSFRLFFQILFTGLCLYVFSVSIGAEWGGFRKVKRLPDSFLSFFLIFHVFFFSPSLFLYKHEYIFDFLDRFWEIIFMVNSNVVTVAKVLSPADICKHKHRQTHTSALMHASMPPHKYIIFHYIYKKKVALSIFKQNIFIQWTSYGKKKCIKAWLSLS